MKRWRQSEKGKLAKKRVSKEKQREYSARYRDTHNGKERGRAYDERYKEQYPERVKARSKVMHAIQDGKLVAPERCERCNKKHQHLNAHHDSYEPEHWLDIRWLCPSCHKKFHSLTP